MSKKRKYTAGTWFAVPLRSNGYAFGVVSHVGKGGIVFGYFFGPKANELPVNLPFDFKPEMKILCGRFGDNGIVNGEWPILEDTPDWNSEIWPMPPMVRVDEKDGIAFIAYYDEKTVELISEERCDPVLVESHPYDRLMGYGSVEISLTKLLTST